MQMDGISMDFLAPFGAKQYAARAGAPPEPIEFNQFSQTIDYAGFFPFSCIDPFFLSLLLAELSWLFCVARVCFVFHVIRTQKRK